jgi:hypothetical protein
VHELDKKNALRYDTAGVRDSRRNYTATDGDLFDSAEVLDNEREHGGIQGEAVIPVQVT